MSDDLAAKISALEAELAALKSQLPKPEPKPMKREPWPRYDPTEGMRMPASAVKAMAQIVPDPKSSPGFNRHAWLQTKGPGEPGGFGAPPTVGGKPVERGSGWVEPLPHSVPGLRYVDQLCDVQDAIDKGEAVKRVAAAIIGKKVGDGNSGS